MIHALFQNIREQACDNNNDGAISNKIERDNNADQACTATDFVEIFG